MSSSGDGHDQTLAWVAVFDTSSLLEAKKIIAAQRQWAFFEDLKKMVMKGEACFPKAVRDELRQKRHHDTPETWSFDAFHYLQYPDPSLDMVAEVLRRASEVIEDDAEGEPADPYVLAHALEIQLDGKLVRVVTEDHVDRLPIKIAMTTACKRLGLASCDLASFLEEIDFNPRPRG